MKVLLIIVSDNIQAFGPRTLTSCLKQHGHTVRRLFLNVIYHQPLPEQVCLDAVELAQGYDLIGVSIPAANYYRNACQITRHLKAQGTAPVIFGGVHPTLTPMECLELADMVGVGECEDSLVELVNRMEQGRAFTDIPGIYVKQNGQVSSNGHGTLIHDLDRIPPPDIGIDNDYVITQGRLTALTPRLYQACSGPTYNTLSTRGCPYHCTYCSNNALQQLYPDAKPIRKRSVEHVIVELEQAVRQWPFIRQIGMSDDSFLARPQQEVEEFARKYRERIGLPLSLSGVNASTVNERKLAPLLEVGLFMVKIGIQSGSDKTQKLYKRPTSNHKILEVARLIHRFRDRIPSPCYDVILDNPWETDDDHIATLRLLAELPSPYRLRTCSLTFYPGTKLYERAVAEGIPIDYDKNEDTVDFRASFWNTGIQLIRDHALLGARLPPWKVRLLTSRTLARIPGRWFRSLFFFLLSLSLYTTILYWKHRYWAFLNRGKQVVEID